MNVEYVIEGRGISKKYKNFALDIPEFQVPKGFATALIGENGAGKTTLLDILMGIRLNYKGDIRYFGEFDDHDREKNPAVKERIGYTGSGNYFLPQWKIGQIEKIEEILFEDFHADRYRWWCNTLSVGGNETDPKQKVSALSDGNRMKLIIASVLARDTQMLVMDEPASPLDPLMRDRLCGIIRDYLAADEGERSVLFSTHNIADMENVTDYAIIMGSGHVIEAGFVEDLKQKYVLVKGDEEDKRKAESALFTMDSGRYGFEGLCLAERVKELSGCDVSTEVPTLTQIAVGVMKHNSLRMSNSVMP